MTLGKSLTTPGPDTGPSEVVYGWDWTATTHGGREPKAIARDLLGSLLPTTVLPGKGIHGWTRSLEAYDADGYKIGAVFLGGRDDVQFLSTSAAADTARDHAVSLDDARTSRVDTRVDTQVSFEDLEGIIRKASNKYGSLVRTVESERRGHSLGRTVYLGSPSSAITVRLYEKWLESPGQYPEGTNRLEVQLRPSSRVKARVSTWTRAETFCASRTTQALARELKADLVPAASLHVNRGTPDLERSLEAMGEQYGKAVDRFMTLTGGDLETVLGYLLGKGTIWHGAS